MFSLSHISIQPLIDFSVKIAPEGVTKPQKPGIDKSTEDSWQQMRGVPISREEISR